VQRDYWAVLTGTAHTPSELMRLVAAHFCDLPPRSLVRFEAPAGLVNGVTIEIRIAPAQDCSVRVIHMSDQSFTLATLEGHPEAGRITFGAYGNDEGQLIFHIRSRARSTTLVKRVGFLAIGDAMQTTTWTDFIANTAILAGAQIRDVIHAETQQVDEIDEDDEPLRKPTFVAQGG
jgi:hypothetical protein